MSPDGWLHYVAGPHDGDAVAEFCKARVGGVHSLWDLKHMLEPGKVAGNTDSPDEVQGWRCLDSMRWIKHMPSGQLFPVHGKVKTDFVPALHGSECRRSSLDGQHTQEHTWFEKTNEVTKLVRLVAKKQAMKSYKNWERVPWPLRTPV